MRTVLEKRAKLLLRGLAPVLLVLASCCWCVCMAYAQGVPAGQNSIGNASGGIPGASGKATAGTDDDLPMIDVSVFEEQARKKQQAEFTRQKTLKELDTAEQEAYQLDKFYEVTSLKTMTELVEDDELSFNVESRPDLVAPINLQSAEARLKKLLILFFIAVVLVLVLFYVLSTLYLLKVSREAGKLRMDMLAMRADSTWVEECERDAQKVRHYDESWDEIDDELYKNG